MVFSFQSDYGTEKPGQTIHLLSALVNVVTNKPVDCSGVKGATEQASLLLYGWVAILSLGLASESVHKKARRTLTKDARR